MPNHIGIICSQFLFHFPPHVLTCNEEFLSVPYGSLATIGLVGSLGLPCPASFSAMTLNWYSSPSFKSDEVNFTPATGTLLSLAQRTLYWSLRSMMYPTMGAPPSDVGGSHSTVAEYAFMDVVTTHSGMPGTSKNNGGRMDQFIIFLNTHFKYK